MKSVIVGTAGHIDHGKTALVKALTGIDADRLEEEKRRGITIDLGFAHLELTAPSGETLRLGFIDVPGHERFVRNMLAGVGGIDLVLLVIAADESIKPQTREHFDICRLLSIRRGLTVLTKCDLVDADALEVVKLEVEEFLRGSFLDTSQSAMVPISSLTGAGLDRLKDELLKAAACVPGKNSSVIARLPVDRVFSMKGFGTVATGTLLSGVIRKDEEMEVIPGGRKVRVRGVQVHGNAVAQAMAGERTALNLAGAAKEEIVRGMVLAPPQTVAATSRVDAILSLLPSAKPLKERSRVHLHAHSFETVAQIAIHQARQIAPGESALARLNLADSALLLPGDRFIIRQFSPLATIGGGVVLDAAPLRTKKEDLHAFLQILSGDDPASILQARIARRGVHGLSLAQAVAETGWPPTRLQALVGNAVVPVGDLFLAGAAFADLKRRIIDALSQYHRQNPLVRGMNKEALREALAVGPEVFRFTCDSLTAEKLAETDGDQIRLRGHGVVMKDEEAESKQAIEHAFAAAGLKVPFLADVLAGLKVDRARAQKIVTLLLRDKVLVKVSDELVFHQAALQQLRQLLAAEKRKSPKIDVARFKDLTGVSRKYAIPLLEYLDREHVTRRVDDQRMIL